MAEDCVSKLVSEHFITCSSKELQIVLQSLVTIRGQKQLQPQFETAVTLAFERLDDLSADHLYALLIAAGSLENKMPYTKLQVCVCRTLCCTPIFEHMGSWKSG